MTHQLWRTRARGLVQRALALDKLPEWIRPTQNCYPGESRLHLAFSDLRL